MGKPCGCGSGGITVRCGVGLTCSGVGSTADPLTISWTIPLDTTACGAVMTCVGAHLTNGLSLTNGQLGVRLSPGGGLEFDANGAIRATGSSGGGTGWRTINDLVTRGNDVVIGALGAGYLFKPETLIRSYRMGQEFGLDAMHVPVRFTLEGWPIVHFDEFFGRIWGEPWNSAAWSARELQSQSINQLVRFPALAGIDNPYLRNQPDGDTSPYWDPTAWDLAHFAGDSPLWGFFGFNEPPQYGVTLLSDVLREVGNRTPLILDLRFPARAANGTFVRSTPAWRLKLFLLKTLALIRQFAVTSSVVVTTPDPKVQPTETTEPVINVLDGFSASGIPVGPFLDTAARAAAYPPDGTWPTTWTWAFCNVDALSKAQVALYRDKVVAGKKLNTIAFMVNRQYTWADRVRDQSLLGGISGDPFYTVAAGGVGATHPLSNPSYRRNFSQWEFNTIDHGHFGATDAVTDVASAKRSFPEDDDDVTIFGPNTIKLTPTTTAYALQGWMSPFADPTIMSLDFTVYFDRMVASGSQSGSWLAVAFLRDNDLPFADWHDAATNTVSRTGYALTMRQDRTILLQAWNTATNAIVTLGTNTVSAVWDGAARKRFIIGVNARGIRVRQVDVTTGATVKELMTVTTSLAVQYRGAYTHFGRYSSVPDEWFGFFRAVTALFNGNTDGPP